MRRAIAVAAIIVAAPLGVSAQDANRAVADGGVKVQGWAGRIDPKEMAAGEKLENSKIMAMGSNGFHVTTGPAVGYWNPANKATGNYTVKATFNEPKYMNLNNHPHPYGVFIGGNDMGTDQQSYLYCAAYGNGRFIVRGFGPEPFQVNGARPEANAAVKTAAGKDQPVTQEVALSVKGDKVECSINGTVVGSYDKAAVLGAGKLKSTDGVYGLRFAHNTEVMVSGFTMTKN